MAKATDAGYGIFVSNWEFLCQIMYFCVEPGIFVSNRAF